MKTVYDLIKDQNLDIRTFIENNYQNISWKGKACTCQFHDDTKESLSYVSKGNYMHCFVCDWAGDIIKFVQDLEKISNLDAAKRVCELEKIPYTNFKNNSLTDEQKKDLEKNQINREKKAAATKKRREIAEQKAKDYTISRITPLSTKLSAHLVQLYLDQAKNLLKLFPNQTNQFLKWSELYLGYYRDHDSLCILNRTLEGTCYNIKPREKFTWDPVKKRITLDRMDAKWVSEPNASEFPFPYDYYMQHTDEIVVLSEGEKDALNLLSYGIRTLTLGGVSNSWETHKEILKDKIVYIWFDHDDAGYINAIKKYNEIKDVAKEVFIVLFYQINPAFPNKFDITDYLFPTEIIDDKRITKKRFQTKEEIFDSITYSTYKLSNELIQDIEEFTSLDLKDFYEKSPYKTFEDIEKEFTKLNNHGEAINISRVKGEKDIKGSENFIKRYDDAKKDKNLFAEVKEKMLSGILLEKESKEKDVNNMMEIFNEMFRRYPDLHKQYSQTHIIDMVISLKNLANRMGYEWADYMNTLYIWTGTHFTELSDKEFSSFLHKHWFFHAKVDVKKQTEDNAKKILENIKAKGFFLERIKKNQENRVVNFLNGTLKITKKGKLIFKEQHSKKDAATNILKFDYDKNAKAPKWTKFLNRVLPDKDDQATLMQYIGYCFLPSHAYETFLMLYGKSGANGKSVIMNVIRSFFGEENTSSLQLQQFKGHELYALFNKIINIGSEIDGQNLDDGQIAILKALVSPKDPISINIKNEKNLLQLLPKEKPKMIFSLNRKVKSGLDDGFFRRVLLLTFDFEIKDEEKVRELEDRFKDEMSGILNIALEHLQTLIKNGKFTKSKRMIKDMEEYKDSINPIRRYINDCIEEDDSCVVAKDLAYAHYCEYAKEKGNKPLSYQMFFTKLYEETKFVKNLNQIRFADKNKMTYLSKDRPSCIGGAFIKPDEIFEFYLKGQDNMCKTNEINYDKESKQKIMKKAPD